MGFEYTLQMSGLTVTGQVREHNEDALGWDIERGIAILADGMGGHNAGEVASQMAVDFIRETLCQQLAHTPRIRPNKGMSKHGTVVHRVISKANASIFQAAQATPAYAKMGTTLVMALFYRNRVVVAHIGDSRCYRWRQGQLEQLTMDHSLLQEILDQGASAEEYGQSPYRNILTRALGTQAKVKADIQEWDVEADDLYLLCSDGLTDLVEDQRIVEVLSAESGGLDGLAQGLVDAAEQSGGKDNISVLLIQALTVAE